MKRSKFRTYRMAESGIDKHSAFDVRNLWTVVITGILLTFVPSTIAYGRQSPDLASQAEWQEAYAKTKTKRASAHTHKRVGIFLMAGAGAMTVAAVKHTISIPGVHCFDSECDRTRPQLPHQGQPYDQRQLHGWLLTGGLAAGVTGIGMFFTGSSQQKRFDEELRQLQDTGKQHGWRISLAPNIGFRRIQGHIAYSW